MASTPGSRRNFFRFCDGVLCRVGSCAGHDRHASGDDFDGHVDDVQPLIMTERGSFTGGAAGNEEIDARFDLPCDQIAQRFFVDGAVLGERRDQSRTTASQLHA